MLTETITIEVETDAARAFNEAPPEDREKMQALFESLLRQYSEADANSLKRIMDEIGENARRRGLTPEILDSILADER